LLKTAKQLKRKKKAEKMKKNELKLYWKLKKEKKVGFSPKPEGPKRGANKQERTPRCSPRLAERKTKSTSSVSVIT
jgi:hypothetical protein